MYVSTPTPDRPRPIADAFKSVGSAVALLGSIATALVGWGVLTSVQGDAVTGLLGLVPGLVTALTQLATAFGVLRKAEGQVTPMDSPAVEVYGQLVQLVPDPEQYRAAVRASAA